MFLFSTLNISISLDLLKEFYNFIESNLWFILSCEIFILSSIVLMASRTSDKFLRGLQGTAATTIIARGIHDAYNSWKNGGSSSNNDDSKDKDTNKDKIKNQENKPRPVPTVTEINEK
jgi:uncharacterized membrane protein